MINIIKYTYFLRTMPSFIHYNVVLMILYQYTNGVWSSNINKQEYYGLEIPSSSEEVSSHETFGIYSSEIESMEYVVLGSAESSESSESYELLTHGQSRIWPVPQDFPSPEASLPLCRGSKKKNKEKQCNKEQNLCRSTGGCRIARIGGTCCNSPGCGTYCQQNKSKCPHPNSIKEACNIKTGEVCSPLQDDCLGATTCCQTQCGHRCV